MQTAEIRPGAGHPAALTDHVDPLGQAVAIGDHAATHVRAHGFFRIEGERRRVPQRTDQPPFVAAEHGLAGVFIDD